MKPTRINGIHFEAYENSNEIRETPPAMMSCRPLAKRGLASGAERECAMCHQPIWVSTTGLDALKLAPTTVVLCDDCTMVAVAAMRIAGRETRLANIDILRKK